jgi:hypothetical protein
MLGVNRSLSQNTIFKSGSGYGQKTVAEICHQFNIPVEKVLKRLKNNYIIADPDFKIKDIVTEEKILPLEVVKIIYPDTK